MVNSSNLQNPSFSFSSFFLRLLVCLLRFLSSKILNQLQLLLSGSAIDSLMIMKQTALVLCVAFGLLLLTLEAEGGRLTLEEVQKAKQLRGASPNSKVGVGVNDVKTIAGDMDNKVAESDSESSDSKGGATHRLFPDIVKPKGSP